MTSTVPSRPKRSERARATVRRTARRDASRLVKAIAGDEALAEVGTSDIMSLASALRPKKLVEGQVLYAPGRRPEGIWLVHKGSVEISKGTGDERRVVAVMRPGDVVGDIYSLADVDPDFRARVVAEGNAVFVTRTAFDSILQQSERIAYLWAKNLAARLVALRGRMVDIMAPSLDRRVGLLILNQARDGTLALSQKTIADMLGARRTSVNRILKSFENEGWIELGYARVEVLDRDAIAELSRGASQDLD